MNLNCFRIKSSESDGDGKTTHKKRGIVKKKISRQAKEKKTASNTSRLDSDYVKSLQGMKLDKNECKSEEQSDQMDVVSNEEQSDQMDVVSSNEPDMSAAGNQNNLASDSANASYSRADSSAPRRKPVRSASVKPTDNTPTYILIPLLKISGEIEEIPPTPHLCKLIEKYPYEKLPPSDIRIRKSYVMSYNKETKNAEWVYEILNKDTAKKNSKITRSFGKNELKGNKDHNIGMMEPEGDGYDQGHLAAAANHRWCQEAYHDTYLFSNMVPQDKSLNRGDWRTIEDYCRDKAKNAEVCNVHVYTGPLYLKEKENKTYDDEEDEYDRADLSKMKRLGGKTVPTHIFKVIIAENEDGTVEEPECYVLPKLDKDTDIKKEANLSSTEAIKNNYSHRIERIQELSKLNFIESGPKVETDHIKTITWTGEGETGELCSATIKVRISSV